MNISCIAIENEPPALEKLVSYINQTPWLELKGQFTNPLHALAYLQSNTIQLLFLDIHMDGITGLQLLDALPQKPYVILTTAYSQYALKGYEYSVTDYLLKPYSFERFLQAVQKIKPQTANTVEPVVNSFIFVKSDYRIVKIETSEILYIEGMRDYRCIVTPQGKTLTPFTFTELCDMLPELLFVRIHKSYVVSLSKIKSIEHNRVYIADKILPIGNTYKEEFYKLVQGKI
jgi:two-component system, LytTR family, response regulator